MKKLLSLVVLVAGVALFAGCLNKPVVTDDTTVPTVETNEVVPADTTETTETVDTTTTTETPTPTAE